MLILGGIICHRLVVMYQYLLLLSFFIVCYETLTNLEACPVNPWSFDLQSDSKYELTLEWVVGSPPGFHSFDELPLIKDTTISKIKAS